MTVQASVSGDVQTDIFEYRSNFQNVSALVTAGDATLNFGAPALDPADSIYKSPYTLTFGGSNLTSTWRLGYEGGVSQGGTFVSTVVMAGQWTGTGTGAGSVEFSYNSAYYNIVSNFVYDGVNTTFVVDTNSYDTNSYVTTRDGEGNNPTIQMTLIGDVVPSPGAAALIGLADAVRGRRRRG